MSSYVKTKIPVAGLWVNVYKSSAAAPDTAHHLPVAVLFVMHGRTGNQEDGSMMSIVEGVFGKYNEEVKEGERPKREVVVVTFDQRNHGSRLIAEGRNLGWGTVEGDGGNDAHAYDMYGTFIGTARDVSFLIDFLPPYLYPNDERTIDQWFASGVSLGGHSTFSALRHEPRITLGVSIVGCPDLITLYKLRASERNVPFAPPYIPASFLSLMQSLDAASAPYTSLSPANPFLNKRILVIAGALDKLVPYDAGKTFVEGLVVGEEGVKKVFVQEDAGHECSPKMVKALAEFVWDEGVGPNARL